MNSITITISSDRFAWLQETSTRLGVTVEDLVLMGIEELQKKQEQEFKNAVEYVLNKNAELYRRLA